MSKWTIKGFSQVIFSFSKSPIYIFIFSLELTSKWDLILLLFISTRSFEYFYKDAIKSSILSETAYSIVSSAYFGISVLFNIKNKSARILLNKKEAKLTSVVHQTARFYFFPNLLIYFQQIHLSLFVCFPHNLNKDKRLLWKFDTINSGEAIKQNPRTFYYESLKKQLSLTSSPIKHDFMKLTLYLHLHCYPLTSKTTSGLLSSFETV